MGFAQPRRKRERETMASYNMQAKDQKIKKERKKKMLLSRGLTLSEEEGCGGTRVAYMPPPLCTRVAFTLHIGVIYYCTHKKALPHVFVIADIYTY